MTEQRLTRGELLAVLQTVPDQAAEALRTIEQLRHAIACACCPMCGQFVGEAEWTINGEEMLVHTGCLVSDVFDLGAPGQVTKQ